MAKGKKKKAAAAAKKKQGKKHAPTKSSVRINSYDPVTMKCPFCSAIMQTKVVYKTKRTACCMMIMRVISGCLPCILRITNSFRDANHYCGRCKRLIGTNSW